jgi:hypothetical protein
MILMRIFQASYAIQPFRVAALSFMRLPEFIGRKGSLMSDMTIIYWRDIPAQVRVGRGRRAARAVLPERFEQAIDRVAMRIGATDGDAYMAEWRDEIVSCEGEPQQAADEKAAALDAAYDKERLKALIDNDGREPAAKG